MKPTATPIDAGMVALASGTVSVPTLYGWDGRPLTSSQLVNPIDFGPGTPLVPRIKAPNYAPRERQYVPGENLIPTPRTESGKQYSFAQLKAWAKMCPLFRVAVEHREKQMRARKFTVLPIEDGKSPKAREKYRDEIETVTRFLRKPNRIDSITYSEWLAQAIEECLVTDSLVFHKQWHNDGSLSYVQISGDTIKILIDQWGHTIGYQQILYGYPATQYRAAAAEEYDKSELAYWMYKPRVDSSYGTSAIEELLPIILTAVKRSQTNLAWYTEGTVPDSFLTAPEGWSPDNIKEYQAWLDNELSDTSSRRRLRVLPDGAGYVQAKPFAYTRDEFEEQASIILAYLGVPKMVLVAQVNKGEAVAQQQDSADMGLAPFVLWWEEHYTEIGQEDLGCKNVEVVCADSLQGQAKADTDRQVMLLGAGAITVDEVRAEIGKEPLTQEGEEKSVGIAPEDIPRSFLEAGVITRNELRATLKLPPLSPEEGGDDFIAIGGFGVMSADAIAEDAKAPKTPPALAPFAGKPGGQNGKPAQDVGTVAEASAAGEGEDAGDDGDGDEPAPAKSERSAWRRFAVARFAKGRHADAFKARDLPAPEAALIRARLAKATTRDEVIGAFVKASKKQLTEAQKNAAIKDVKAAALRLFAAQYGETMKRAKETLKGNA